MKIPARVQFLGVVVATATVSYMGLALPWSPFSRELIWHQFGNPPMIACWFVAVLGAALLLRPLLRRPSTAALIYSGIVLALASGILFAFAIGVVDVLFERHRGPIDALFQGLLFVPYGAGTVLLSLHVAWPIGILGAWLLRRVTPDPSAPPARPCRRRAPCTSTSTPS